ncbi:tyrosine-type recombinase/integrase [Sinorhizobium meliloti]|uniref:tyrosine-type recombinase/integrase n=1 Tax=Rhizobium meliloti TaxID=382 RepID=UPI0004115F40|nr:integrase family protein [Sinorhizobium meliloti]
MKLTAASIATLPPRKLPYPDSLLPGLALYVGTRRRTWLLRYRSGGGKQVHDKIGYFIPNAPEDSESLGLAAAREKAREILGRVEAGVPVAEAPVHHPKTGGETVEQSLDKYEKYRTRQGGRIKSLPKTMKALHSALADYATLPVANFTRRDLRRAAEVIADRGSVHAASAFLRYAGPWLKWLVERELIETNFARDVSKPAAVKKRKRVLSDEEIRLVWTAAGSMEGVRRDAAKNYGRAVQLLMLTGQRLDEVISLKHGDILDGKWRLKGEHNKSDRDHVVTFSKTALKIIGTGEADQRVFPGVHGKISGFSRLKKDLDNLSGTSGWRLHDLRRTLFTRLVEDLDFPEEIAHAVCNHKQQGLSAVYNQASRERQKAKAWEAWDDRLRVILATQKVVTLAKPLTGLK